MSRSVFHASAVVEDELLVVRCAGDIDTSACETFRTTLLGAIAAHGSVPLLVDLTDVTFVDSSAFRALLATKARLDIQGRRMLLSPGDGTIRRLLRAVGLEERFEIV